MKRWFVLTVAAAFALGGWGRPCGASTHRLDRNLKCTLRVGITDYLRAGSAVPVIMFFDNAGEQRVLDVDVGGLVSARYAVPPGGGHRRCLYVPVWLADTNVSFRCSVTDAESGDRLKAFYPGTTPDVLRTGRRRSYPGGRGASKPPLLCVTISDRSAFAINTALDRRYELKLSRVSPGYAPDRWLGYTCADLVVVPHRVWSRTDFPRDALIDYMAMGGLCLIVDVPPERREEMEEGIRERAPCFSTEVGAVADVPPTMHVGMGGAALVGSELLQHPGGSFFERLAMRTGQLDRTSDYGGDAYGRRGRGRSTPPIEDVGRAPFWPVLLALTAFSVLVGPVGWWYVVSRKKKGLFYYVTAPLLSLGMMGIVVVADLLNEGVRPYVSCRAVRFVDQRVGRSLDISQFGVYAPLNLGQDLMGRRGEMPHFFNRRGENLPKVRLEEDRQVYPGALPARRKVWFGREETRRERRRLVVGVEAGSVRVENHLGSPLSSVVVAWRGRYALIESLDAGEEVTMPVRQSPPPGYSSYRLRNLLTNAASGTIAARSGALQSRWQKEFEEGQAYFAQMDGGFDEQVWLGSYRDKGISGVIFGVY